MKYFRINVNVRNASGTQTYLVAGKNLREAMETFENGGGIFEAEEIEVTDLDEIDIGDCEEITEHEYKIAEESED